MLNCFIILLTKLYLYPNNLCILLRVFNFYFLWDRGGGRGSQWQGLPVRGAPRRARPGAGGGGRGARGGGGRGEGGVARRGDRRRRQRRGPCHEGRDGLVVVRCGVMLK